MSDVARRADDMSVFKLKKNHLSKYNPHYNASLTLNATLSQNYHKYYADKDNKIDAIVGSVPSAAFPNFLT